MLFKLRDALTAFLLRPVQTVRFHRRVQRLDFLPPLVNRCSLVPFHFSNLFLLAAMHNRRTFNTGQILSWNKSLKLGALAYFDS